jgi:hypothetical protein
MTSDNELNIGRVRFNGWIWQTASQFNDAANTLFDTDVAKYSTAILMNYAFACELALKACAVQKRHNSKRSGNGIIPTASSKSASRGHNLTEVFDKLPDETKESISTAFKNETNKELRSQLNEFQDYFVDVRYSFEQRPRSYDLPGMQNLANALVVATLDAARTSDGF